MSAEDVQTEIIAPMQRLYLAPKAMPEDQAALALREYVDALSGHSKAVLGGAWKAVRDAHTGRSWPSVSAFALAAKRESVDQAASRKWANAGKGEANERWNYWLGVRHNPVAHHAVKAGVAWSFKCAIVHDGKRVEQIDLRELVLAREHAERTAERIERGDHFNLNGRTLPPMDGEMADKALAMWRTLQIREAETVAEINGQYDQRYAA